MSNIESVGGQVNQQAQSVNQTSAAVAGEAGKGFSVVADEMSIGAREMNGTSAVLAEISSRVGESIDQIGAQVDQFTV